MSESDLFGGSGFEAHLADLVQRRDEDAIRIRYHAGELDLEGETVLEAIISERLEKDEIRFMQDRSSRLQYVTDETFRDYLRGRRLAREGRNDNPPLETMRQLIADIPDMPPTTLRGEPAPELPEWRLKTFLLSQLEQYPDLNLWQQPRGSLLAVASITCLDDQLRTKRFLQAIDKVLVDAPANEYGTVELCDAGCGAVPVLAIYAALADDRVRCTALELNPDSAAMARQLVQSFGLQDRIIIVETDATKYQPKNRIDVLISETMHSGLTAEPIVDIMANLRPYVQENGVVLPSGVDIHARIVSADDYARARSENHLAVKPVPVIEGDWPTQFRYTAGDTLPKVEFDVPTAGLPLGSYAVRVCCTVNLDAAEPLRPYDSLITMPLTAAFQGGQKTVLLDGTPAASAVRISYRTGSSLIGALSVVGPDQIKPTA